MVMATKNYFKKLRERKLKEKNLVVYDLFPIFPYKIIIPKPCPSVVNECSGQNQNMAGVDVQHTCRWTTNLQ